MRKEFFASMAILLAAFLALTYFYSWGALLLIFWSALMIVGIQDCLQTKHAILRNFPVVGHFRYILESIRPEIQQYFIEDYENGRPFSREERSIVYQRAKGELDTLPFGTQREVYGPGYEWIDHSLIPVDRKEEAGRVLIGNKLCSKPYSASLLNISAMSFGSLSKQAITALSKGAKKGGFAHNTGEGGVSPYHLEGGGDLIMQVGTAYFGCRSDDGRLDPEKFKEKANLESVKMIEIKLSQGAKPGHGGILPGAKVTPEIAGIRGVPVGKDVISPPYHPEFSNPIELLEFIQKLRDLSSGKPIGIKLCVGKRRQFFSLCKAMRETKIYPDFISVDGGEGGTGAAPLEFSNYIGSPLRDGLVFVRNALLGCDLKKHIKVIASGRVISGFNIATNVALGADLCYSARGMMFALGCIQALRCNSNHCPAGVATQDPQLAHGLDINSKAVRIYNYHHETVSNFLEVLSAAGMTSPEEIRPHHLNRRINQFKVKNFEEIYSFVSEGDLLDGKVPTIFEKSWSMAKSSSF